MTRQALLPRNSTRFETEFSLALDRSDSLNPGADRIIWSTLSSNPDFLPLLIEEYGLSEVTQFLPSLTDAITRGIAWQRMRGTPEGVRLGLAWLTYIAALEEAPVHRRKWHHVQLGFPALPANDNPDLDRIDNVVRLSLPARSKLRRGWHVYNVRAAEADHSRLDGCALESDSGTALRPGGAVWSFGRAHEFVHDVSEIELVSIDNWIAEGSSLQWIIANYPWSAAKFPWDSTPAIVRRTVMAMWFERQNVHIALKRADAAIIGFRRARVVRAVRPLPGGSYSAGGLEYGSGTVPGNTYIEAMTDFDDADGVTAASVAVVVGGIAAPGVKPGAMWLPPSGITSFQTIAVKNISVPLRKTVRERFKFLMRF